LASVSDLVHMKLTSFRLKDKVHIQDLDSVGLITPEIEQALPEAPRPAQRSTRDRVSCHIMSAGGVTCGYSFRY
jgi:hypothetical protein